jgi:hypothetical protein
MAVTIAPVFRRGLISEISIVGLVVMGAGCAHFEYGQLSYMKFCAKSLTFLPEVSGDGSQSQM